jgi:hypothetical protein|eukprot:SAG25_NODE_434_length_8070_cov_90.584117_3_plen_172_part_00
MSRRGGRPCLIRRAAPPLSRRFEHWTVHSEGRSAQDTLVAAVNPVLQIVEDVLLRRHGRAGPRTPVRHRPVIGSPCMPIGSPCIGFCTHCDPVMLDSCGCACKCLRRRRACRDRVARRLSLSWPRFSEHRRPQLEEKSFAEPGPADEAERFAGPPRREGEGGARERALRWL